MVWLQRHGIFVPLLATLVSSSEPVTSAKSLLDLAKTDAGGLDPSADLDDSVYASADTGGSTWMAQAEAKQEELGRKEAQRVKRLMAERAARQEARAQEAAKRDREAMLERDKELYARGRMLMNGEIRSGIMRREPRDDRESNTASTKANRRVRKHDHGRDEGDGLDDVSSNSDADPAQSADADTESTDPNGVDGESPGSPGKDDDRSNELSSSSDTDLVQSADSNTASQDSYGDDDGPSPGTPGKDDDSSDNVSGNSDTDLAQSADSNTASQDSYGDDDGPSPGTPGKDDDSSDNVSGSSDTDLAQSADSNTASQDSNGDDDGPSPEIPGTDDDSSDNVSGNSDTDLAQLSDANTASTNPKSTAADESWDISNDGMVHSDDGIYNWKELKQQLGDPEKNNDPNGVYAGPPPGTPEKNDESQLPVTDGSGMFGSPDGHNEDMDADDGQQPVPDDAGALYGAPASPQEEASKSNFTSDVLATNGSLPTGDVNSHGDGGERAEPLQG